MMHLRLVERQSPWEKAKERGKAAWEKWCKEHPKTPGCNNDNDNGDGRGKTTTSATPKPTPKPTPTPKPDPAPAPAPAPAPVKPTTTQAPAKPVTTQPPAKNNPAPSPTQEQQQPAETKPAATDRGGAGGSGDTASTASPIVGASPVVSSVNDEFTGVGKGEGSGSGGDRGQGGDGTGRGFNPLATGVAGIGNESGGNGGNSNFVSGATSGIEPPAASAGNSSSNKGLGGGAIAGIVIGLLALLGLVFFVLFLLRKKSPTVQKMFSNFGNQRPGSSYPTSVHGTEGMDKTLLAAGAGAAAGGGAAGPAARRDSKAGQLPMRQTDNTPPPLLLVSAPNTGRNLTSPTNDSPTSSRAFTPTPVSPMSPASILGSAPPPAAFYPGRPTYVPPENMSSYPGRPQYVPPAAATAAAVAKPYVPPPPARKPVPRSQTAPLPQQQPQAAMITQNLHVAHAAGGTPHRSGSISSVSSGSALSAILNPAQMVWPMPPLTPPGSAPDTPKTGQGHGRHNSSKGSQPYVDFQAAGQTVVRINNSPGPIRGQQRRPSGY